MSRSRSYILVALLIAVPAVQADEGSGTQATTEDASPPDEGSAGDGTPATEGETASTPTTEEPAADAEAPAYEQGSTFIQLAIVEAFLPAGTCGLGLPQIICDLLGDPYCDAGGAGAGAPFSPVTADPVARYVGVSSRALDPMSIASYDDYSGVRLLC